MGGTGVEIGTRKPNYIDGCPQSPQTAVNTPVPVEAVGRIVGQDHAEIQIAIRAGVATSFRTKKIYSERMIKLDEAAGNFRDCFLGCELGLSCPDPRPADYRKADVIALYSGFAKSHNRRGFIIQAFIGAAAS